MAEGADEDLERRSLQYWFLSLPLRNKGHAKIMEIQAARNRGLLSRMVFIFSLNNVSYYRRLSFFITRSHREQFVWSRIGGSNHPSTPEASSGQVPLRMTLAIGPSERSPIAIGRRVNFNILTFLGTGFQRDYGIRQFLKQQL